MKKLKKKLLSKPEVPMGNKGLMHGILTHFRFSIYLWFSSSRYGKQNIFVIIWLIGPGKKIKFSADARICCGICWYDFKFAITYN